MTGLSQTNTIAVVVRGDQITFYVNNQLVTLQPLTNTMYTHGQIGFTADGPPPFSFSNTSANPTEVVYTNLKVWKL